MNDTAAKQDARRDVLAYMRALIENRSEDASVIVHQALTSSEGSASEFIWQLSTLCAAAMECRAQIFGSTASDFIAKLQSVELALQAAGGAR